MSGTLERFAEQEKQYKIWQAQATAKELLKRLQGLEQSNFGTFPSEISQVNRILERLESEQQSILDSQEKRKERYRKVAP